jgi:two-component system, OmpR family, phosphate regulon response regulator PhoB
MGHILVVEDESALAELISINLTHAGHAVALASTSDQAIDQVDHILPDLILLDWMLPGQSGLALAKRWRAHPRTRDVPIIMLTAKAQESDKVAALDSGADDYLTKPFSTQELMARIRAVLRRKAPQALDSLVQLGPLIMDPSTRRVRCGEQAIRLGPTEFKLLYFFMTHPDRIHTRVKLLDQVWGDHVFIEERTIDVHIKRLREALAPAHCDGMLQTVRGAGYLLAHKVASSP